VAPPKLPVGAPFVAFCISSGLEHTPADEEVKSVGDVHWSLAGAAPAQALLILKQKNNTNKDERKAVSDMVFQDLVGFKVVKLWVDYSCSNSNTSSFHDRITYNHLW
jgi:hypothetical protein